MQITNQKPLSDIMRKAPLAPKTVSEFRDQALQAVDQAIDIFFKPEREVAEGKKAYDQLSEVERALRSYQGRIGDDHKAVMKKYEKAKDELNPHTRSQDDVGKTESMLADGKPLQDGFRELSPSQGRGTAFDFDTEQKRIHALVQKMSDVLPLYGSVAMVPGPLSVSLKDHIKETLIWENSSASSSGSRFTSLTSGLFRESAAKKVMTSSSSTESSGKQETMTVDERVLPGLHQIRGELSEMAYAPEAKTEIQALTTVWESEKVPYTEGILFWKEDRIKHEKVNYGTLKHTAEVVSAPARISLQGEQGNDGLTRPGAGAELVDLVSEAELNQEFVDAFREQSLQVLDDATSTLFNPQREVAEGRQRYDQLSNLQRALKLAKKRFARQDRYQPEPLQDPIAKLDQVAPLFACVAMVPGEMSSSVKNHAKELLTAVSKASSSSSSSTRATQSRFFSESRTAEFASESSRSSSFLQHETSTTDERIMPVLHELRMQLDQLALGENKNGSFLNVRGAGDANS